MAQKTDLNGDLWKQTRKGWVNQRTMVLVDKSSDIPIHRKKAITLKEGRKRRSDREFRVGEAVTSAQYRRIRRTLDNHTRVAKEVGAIPAWWGEWDDFSIQEAAELAQLRAAETGIQWSIDHMIPKGAAWASGLHCGDNLQVIPRWLNVAKNRKQEYTERGEWCRASFAITPNPESSRVQK